MDDFTTFDFLFGVNADVTIDESILYSAGLQPRADDEHIADVPLNADRNPMDYGSSCTIA